MMKKILSRLFNVLKYILLIGAFILIFLGIIYTYRRLEKNLVEAIPVFLPFALLFITFIVNAFIKRSDIKNNLFFNFTTCLVLIAIIVVGFRALTDKNMLLYFKYKINYNPLYLSDNLSTIEVMLYCLFGANVLFLTHDILSKPKPEKIKGREKEQKLEKEKKIKPKKEKKVKDETVVEDSKEETEIVDIKTEVPKEEKIETKEEVTSDELILEPVTEVKIEEPVVVEEIFEKKNEEIIEIPAQVENKIEVPVEEQISVIVEPETITEVIIPVIEETKEEIVIEDPAKIKAEEEQKKREKEKYKSLLKKYNIEETAVHENLAEKLKKQSKK